MQQLFLLDHRAEEQRHIIVPFLSAYGGRQSTIMGFQALLPDNGTC
jgi:hypothetical protein